VAPGIESGYVSFAGGAAPSTTGVDGFGFCALVSGDSANCAVINDTISNNKNDKVRARRDLQALLFMGINLLN
jgi:hypothetical protein